jgi:hypothetical protein
MDSLDDAKSRFDKDTAKHEMHILRDDGLYRHLRFKEPGTNVYYYDLITWPGCLVVRGDMGTYAFSRTDDMFDFFGPGPRINPPYWAQKLLAADCNGEHAGDTVKRYSEAAFRQTITEYFDEYMNKDELSGDEREHLWTAIENDVLSMAEQGPHVVREAVEEFEWRSSTSDETRQFYDSWELDFTEYTICFIWCLFAVVSGIAQYRDHTAQVTAA